MQSLTIQLEMPLRLDVIGHQVRIAGQRLVHHMHHAIHFNMVARHDTRRIVDHPRGTVRRNGGVQITPQHVFRLNGTVLKPGRFIVAHASAFAVNQMVEHHLLDRLHGVQEMFERPITLFSHVSFHRLIVRHETSVCSVRLQQRESIGRFQGFRKIGILRIILQKITDGFSGERRVILSYVIRILTGGKTSQHHNRDA